MTEPIFKKILGKSWEHLPDILKKHYSNRSYSRDITTVKGNLNIYCNRPLIWISAILRWLGQIPATNNDNITTVVHFKSGLDSKSFHLQRTFHFTHQDPYVFESRMIPWGDSVIEIMKYGFTWKMKYSWDDNKLTLRHKGYGLYVCGLLIPLPLTFLIGATNAVEYPIDDNSFYMEVTISHPLWGNLYGYHGLFEVIE